MRFTSGFSLDDAVHTFGKCSSVGHVVETAVPDNGASSHGASESAQSSQFGEHRVSLVVVQFEIEMIERQLMFEIEDSRIQKLDVVVN